MTGTKEGSSMDRAAFEASAKNAGYRIETSTGTPNKVTQPHAHDVDVRVLVVAGELTVNARGVSQTYRAGDAFDMPAGCVHSERHGANGSEVVVARRTPPPIPG
jgi:quercetin dioxygenase-like cupin family protein